jgi:hypothetical protein
MSEHGLSPNVADFIESHVGSIESLEVLVALAREPNRLWSPAEVLQTIQSSEASVAARLGELTASGLVREQGGQFQFAPATDDVRQTVNTLMADYKERRVRVVQAIYADSGRRAREFSEAFRFRRKK